MDKITLKQIQEDEDLNSSGCCVIDGKEYGLGSFKTYWLKYAIQDPKIIFDVGCYDCGDSIRFKKEFPNSTVYAFEASPARYNMTKMDADKYDIKIYNIAISNKDGTHEFYDSLVDKKRVDAQGSFFKHSQEYKSRNPRIIQNESPILVETICLDTFCKNNNIIEIDLLHVDVEGAEKLVIEGMKTLRPKVIFLETLDIIDGNNAPSWTDCPTNSLEIEKYLLENEYILGKILSADRLYYHKSVIEE